MQNGITNRTPPTFVSGATPPFNGWQITGTHAWNSLNQMLRCFRNNQRNLVFCVILKRGVPEAAKLRASLWCDCVHGAAYPFARPINHSATSPDLCRSTGAQHTVIEKINSREFAQTNARKPAHRLREPKPHLPQSCSPSTNPHDPALVFLYFLKSWLMKHFGNSF